MQYILHGTNLYVRTIIYNTAVTNLLWLCRVEDPLFLTVAEWGVQLNALALHGEQIINELTIGILSLFSDDLHKGEK